MPQMKPTLNESLLEDRNASDDFPTEVTWEPSQPQDVHEMERMGWICLNPRDRKGGIMRHYVLSDKGRKKLSSMRRKAVIRMDLEGNYIEQYASMTEASEKTGVATTSICGCCKGKFKTAGGFRWRYAEE